MREQTAETRPVDRVVARDKVTGAARYAGEFAAEGLCYGVIVPSTIARGRVTSIDARAALAHPDVLQVFTHENARKGAPKDEAWRDPIAPHGSPYRPLHDAEIRWAGQPVALVVATTFEAARHAATLVRVRTEAAPHQTDLDAVLDDAYPPKSRPMGYEPPPKPKGSIEAGLAEAAAQVDAVYTHPCLPHNPMEPHATTVELRADGGLLIHDKHQGVCSAAQWVRDVFELPADRVRVVTPFVGGGFGSGLRPVYNLYLAVMAALELGRSVRVVLTRPQMFGFGYRPQYRQRVVLGARGDGTLTALAHEAVGVTSRFERYCENVVNWSGVLYASPNLRLEHRVAELDLYTPLDARAPGAASGAWAIESAMDELACALGVDPVELRLRNYTERDPIHDRPFSSKALRDCYRRGAEAFGWAKRDPAPGSMRRDGKLIGWGMATGIWETMQMEASARATLTVDGRLRVQCAANEIGPGTYTAQSVIAAEALGLDVAAVRFELGDTDLPAGPTQGGSMTTATVGPAVRAACAAIGRKLLGLAQRQPRSPFADAAFEDVVFTDGEMRLRDAPDARATLREIMRRARVARLDGEADAAPGEDADAYTSHAHSAVFVEVEVDEVSRMIRVSRAVVAAAAGRIISPKTATSQMSGGVVWGISQALHEHGVLDHALGRFVNDDLAEYHVPVNADIGEIEVIWVDERDEVMPLGVKGVGELGIVGTAAAVANAVHHATGVRVRALPIRLDDLL